MRVLQLDFSEPFEIGGPLTCNHHGTLICLEAHLLESALELSLLAATAFGVVGG